MFRSMCCGSLCLCFSFLAGCGGKPPMTINTDPPQAMVSVNEVALGESPVQHAFRFDKKKTQTVTVSKTGYHDRTLQLTAKSPQIKNNKKNAILLTLPQDEAWMATRPSEAANKGLRVQVNPIYKPQAMWQILVDAVTSRYSNIDTMDASSMYLKAIPVVKRFRHPERGEVLIRTQFYGAINSTNPLVYKVKIDSEYSDRTGQWVPYSRVFKEDADLAEEIQNRLK